MRRVGRISVAASAVVLLLVVTALPVAATSPSVVLLNDPGPEQLSGNGQFQPAGSTGVASGTWWVTATATLDAGFNNTVSQTDVTCRLASENGPIVIDQATWALQTTTSDRATESLFLTGVFSAATNWTVGLDCSSSTAALDVSGIAITAVKGSRSSSPMLISKAVDGPATVLGGSTFRTVASLKVPAGKWWIVAKTNMASTASVATDNETCRIRLSSTDTDQSGRSLYYTGQTGSTGEAAVQVAHTFSSAGTANLQCSGSEAVSVDHVRLVGIKAGKLTKHAFGGGTTSSGSGTPKVVAGYRASSSSVAVGSPAVVASLSVPSGKWLVSAKLLLSSGAWANQVDCVLSVPGSTNYASSRGGPGDGLAGIYLQGAFVSTSARTVTVSCGAGDIGPTVSYVRITALSASSVSFGL